MKRSKRIFWSVVLMTFPFKANTIANIIRKNNLYGSVGENCLIQLRKLPLYSELIHLHNNICIGSNVVFVTHDATYLILNKKYGPQKFIEEIGCIEIMDNVFIGSGTQILNNVRIGSNVIIGAGSVVTKDIPDNTVYSGNPARYICDFEDFIDLKSDSTQRFKLKYGIDRIQGVDFQLASQMYENFKKEKDKKRKTK